MGKLRSISTLNPSFKMKMKISKFQEEELLFLAAIVLISLCILSKWFFILWLIPLGIYGNRLYRKRRYGRNECPECRRDKDLLHFSPEAFPVMKGEPVCFACVPKVAKRQKEQDEMQERIKGIHQTIGQIDLAVQERLGPKKS
jgi:hypothetical protein